MKKIKRRSLMISVLMLTSMLMEASLASSRATTQDAANFISNWCDTRVYEYFGNPNTKGSVGPKFVTQLNDINLEPNKDIQQQFCTEGAEVTVYLALEDAGLTDEEIRTILPLKYDSVAAMNWAKANGVWHDKTENGFSGGYQPKTGDLILYKDPKKKNKTCHTEVFRYADGDKYITTNLNEKGVINSTMVRYINNERNSRRRKIFGVIEVRYDAYLE